MVTLNIITEFFGTPLCSNLLVATIMIRTCILNLAQFTLNINNINVVLILYHDT